jgi:type IV fimbrial biogenesis protein FimT
MLKRQVMRQKQVKGFTLAELMVVIAIIGITTAIAIPYFVGQMPRYRLNGAARQVMGDLMWARMEAVSLNRKVKVFFLSNNHEYKICDDADNNGTVADGEGDVRLKDIHDEYHDVTISSNNDPIFLPRGTATSLPTITLTNPSGSKTITISIAGRVSIS